MTLIADFDTIDFAIDGLRITRLGLDLPEGLSYDAWQGVGRKLRQVHRAIQWLIGDWIRYGERHYGEMYSQAVEETGMEPGSLRNMVYVAERFPAERRREAVPFTHFAEVAALPPDEAEVVLDRVEAEQLSTRETREIVRHRQLVAGRATVLPRPDSIVETDGEALVTLLGIHAVREPRIIDVTHNEGVMWLGVPYRPHRSDIDPDMHRMGFTDTVADFRHLPFPDASFEVVVFDPTHISDGGEHTSGLGPMSFPDRYGTQGEEVQGVANIAGVFEAFLREARRVLVPVDGVILAKIANQVHDSAYQDQARMLKNEAERQGYVHCDEVVRASIVRGQLVDPRWRHVYHVRGVHTFWEVFRVGELCHRRDEVS